MLNQKIFKALANTKRLEMLKWLKHPEQYFDKPDAVLAKMQADKGGVCVGDIQKKAELSQSTVSAYLQMLEDVGFLEAEKHGKWTYYRRNEAFIEAFNASLQEEL